MEEKFQSWLQLKREKGLSFNEALSKKHAFLNPNIASQLLSWAELDEYGTELKWHDEAELEYDAKFDYEAIAHAQRAEWETKPSQERSSMVFRHSIDDKRSRMTEKINAAISALPTAKRKHPQ